mmetsp:Transcript_5365/g.11975  ORF Transcript_5365/g.11975 Transcript_5365/m.11975 type:complete len:366 (-) Transcript_5365:154-1251(-)
MVVICFIVLAFSGWENDVQCLVASSTKRKRFDVIAVGSGLRHLISVPGHEVLLPCWETADCPAAGALHVVDYLRSGIRIFDAQMWSAAGQGDEFAFPVDDPLQASNLLVAVLTCPEPPGFLRLEYFNSSWCSAFPDLLTVAIRPNAVRLVKHNLSLARQPTNGFLKIARGLTDKVDYHAYDVAYDQWLPPLGRAVKLLEVGLGCTMQYGPGGSMEVWSRYFAEAEIHVIESNADCASAWSEALASARILVHVGDQSDAQFLQAVRERVGLLDLIVDDGSHLDRPTMDTLRALWPSLRPGGAYVIEDIVCGRSVNQGCMNGDPLRSPFSSGSLVNFLFRTIEGGLPDLHHVECQYRICMLLKDELQ